MAPDDLEVGQGTAGTAQRQRGPRGCTASAAAAALGVADIHYIVLGVLGVQGDVVEPALAAVGDRGHTGDGARRALGDRVDEFHVASSLDYEDFAVGQEGARASLMMGGNGCRCPRLRLARSRAHTWRRNNKNTQHQRQNKTNRESEMLRFRGGRYF